MNKYSARPLRFLLAFLGALAVSQRAEAQALLATLDLGKDGGHVTLSPDGKILAHGGSGDDNDKVVLWDVSNPRAPKRRAALAGHEEWVRGIWFSPDGKLLAAAGYDKLVKLWDVATGKPGASIKTTGTQSAAFSPDGKTL